MTGDVVSARRVGAPVRANENCFSDRVVLSFFLSPRARHPRLPVHAEGAQAQGEVRRDLAAATLTLLLQGGLAACLAAWLAAPEGGAGESLRKQLSRAADLVLDGFRKRNERVSGPARASSAPR
mgnify:CR=1 FL=1